jgi:arylsulfatase A-like enzyme
MRPLLASLLLPAVAGFAAEKPNVLFVFCDNLGNGDVACFNPLTKHRTRTSIAWRPRA